MNDHTDSRASWIEISELCYANNIAFLRSCLRNGTELAVVVKGNAYGHGLLTAAQLALRCGIRRLCVNSAEEATVLQAHGIDGTILILGPIVKSELAYCIESGFQLTVSSLDALHDVLDKSSGTRRRAIIHLKLDSGMHRQGLYLDELEQAAEILRRRPDIVVGGTCTHFSRSDEPENAELLDEQRERFQAGLELLNSAGIACSCRHAAASAGALWAKQVHWDMVRVGLAQYGLWPSQAVRAHCLGSHSVPCLGLGLSPILSWKAKISSIKRIGRGAKVGYGATFTAPATLTMAIVPAGYADGLPRLLSNRGHILVHGQRVPIIGRVSMDMVTVDITAVPGVATGDEVVLLGKQGSEEITAEEIAEHSGTINYEIVTRLSPRLARRTVSLCASESAVDHLKPTNESTSRELRHAWL